MRSSRGCQSDASVRSKPAITSGAGARWLPVELTRHPLAIFVTVISSVPIGVEAAKIVNDAVPSAGAGAVCAAAATLVSRIAESADVNCLKRRMDSGHSGYQQARETAAFDERRDRGRVLLTGSVAKSFLQALVTNEVASLPPGAGCYAALLTPQGRMITDMTVLAGPEGEPVLLVVPSDAAAPLAARLDRLIFSEDVVPADITSATDQFSVVGPEAGAVVDRILRQLGHDEVADRIAGDLRHATLSGRHEDGLVLRNRELGVDGIDIIVKGEDAEAWRQALAASTTPLSSGARKALRVEAGRPEFGVDMTTDTIPLEANLLDRAISTTKGCYVGQEVIIRVLHRGGGRVAKKLVRVRFDAGAPPPDAGATLQSDGRDIGRVTTAVWSPREAAAVALGYVHRDLARDGAEVQLADGRRGVVSEI